jgi:hypothetical protein
MPAEILLKEEDTINNLEKCINYLYLIIIHSEIHRYILAISSLVGYFGHVPILALLSLLSINETKQYH